MRRVWRWFPVLLCLAVSSCSFPNSPSSTNSKIIINRGSDTLVNLALAWAEAYAVVDPTVSISVSGGGSGVGLTSLIQGTTDIANASRAISGEELAEAQKNGVSPNEFIVARDAIAVIIHPANPVDQLTLQQVSDIFTGKINNWAEVGGEDRPIVRVSREVNSGTHVYFLEAVIRLGRKDDPAIFSTDTLLLPSSEVITSEVSQNPNAIGYDGLGYVTDAVKILRLSTADAGPFVAPSKETALDGTYPVSRDLYMYTNGEPAGAIQEYLNWILSAQAQEIVGQKGFVPIG
ncbi:MAG: phosphate ABC transporter substrate-binding protein [Anaerolineales bacterium]|nr:phosphate ABC transporter substrate-binding protein [Anaerolineales bacterium]